MVADHGIRLRSLTAEGFKGVNRKLSVEFAPKATVIAAPNGRGKSTLLGAIEWALFGDLRFQTHENLAQDELVSVFHPSGRATVELVLGDGEHETRVIREKALRKRASALTVETGSGETLEGEPASEHLYRYLGLSFDDFYRAAFLHQDSIRGLLTEEPRDRDEAMDRLLGVEEIRNILMAMKIKPVSDALGDIEHQEQLAMERLTGAGETAQANRDRARAEAIDAEWAEAELALGPGLAEARRLVTDAQSAASKFGVETGTVPSELESLEDMERAARFGKSIAKDVRISVGRRSPLEEALGRLRKINESKGDLSAASSALSDAKAELEGHDKKHGLPDEWGGEAQRLAAERSDVDASRLVLDVHGRVVAEAIAYLEAVPGASACPVCGDPKVAKDLARKLQKEVQTGQSEALAKLTNRFEEIKARLEAIQDLRKARGKLEKAVTEAEARLEETRVAAWELLEAEANAKDPFDALVTKEQEISGRLDTLQNASQDREQKLQKLDERAERLRVLSRFLRADQVLGEVNAKSATTDDGGSTKLEENKAQLLGLRSDLTTIVQALGGLANGRAQQALEACGDAISHTYGRLCDHPYFSGLKIELGQKSLQGVERNTYRIVAFSQDGHSTGASSRLSTAQMNCVALSVYLSLSKILHHNLGFLLLDDPSQNLDSEHKTALSSTLSELLPSTQLVIGTHDTEFDAALKPALGTGGVRWYHLDWAAREGTSLNRAGT